MPNLTEIHMKIFHCRELLYQIRLEWSPIKTVSSTLVVKKNSYFISKRGLKGTQIAKYLAYLDVCRIFLHYPVFMCFFDSESF